MTGARSRIAFSFIFGLLSLSFISNFSRVHPRHGSAASAWRNSSSQSLSSSPPLLVHFPLASDVGWRGPGVCFCVLLKILLHHHHRAEEASVHYIRPNLHASASNTANACHGLAWAGTPTITSRTKNHTPPARSQPHTKSTDGKR